MNQESKSCKILVDGLPFLTTSRFLHDLFSKIGEFEKIVKKDDYRKCITYAYIIFANRRTAERAVQELNYTKVDDDTIRVIIMDPGIKKAIKSGEGKLFIKNLDPYTEETQLHELFSRYGDIISCQIPTKYGFSRGYGYVQFKRKEDAEQAMRELCEASINECPIKIEPYRNPIPNNAEETYTNVYVNNLPDSITDDRKLSELFSQFGDVQTPKLCVSEEGNSRGFGFCSMTTHEDAKKAVEGLNGLELDGKVLSCKRARPIDENFNELKEKRRQDREFYKGRNLYIRNFDEDMTEEELKRIFEQFGVVESIKIMREADGKSMEYGYVCYETILQANDCLSKSALLTVYDQQAGANKQLYVSLDQSKGERILKKKLKTRIQQQYPAQSMAIPGMPMGMPMGMPRIPAYFGYYPPIGIPFPSFFNSMDAKSKLKSEILEQNPPNQRVLLQRIEDMSDMTAQHLISNQQLLNQWYNQE